MAHRVVVYTAPGCSLCGPAVEAVRAVCGGDYAVVDITSSADLERTYRERIPVVEVDGIARFQYHVDPDELRRLL
jgi:glutaredoxin-related protein